MSRHPFLLLVAFSSLLLAAIACGDDSTDDPKVPGGGGGIEGGGGSGGAEPGAGGSGGEHEPGEGGSGGEVDPGQGGAGGEGGEGGEEPSEPIPTTVEISSVWEELVVGETETLTVRVLDEVGDEIEGVELSFSSSDPDVVSVDGTTGAVRGEGPGTARIEITAGSASGELEVEVYFRFKDFTGGHHQTCALTLSGEAWCWGSNERGFLGDGGTTSAPIPVRVVGDIEFNQILGTEGQVCGLAKDGEIWCWGDNSNGATFGPDNTAITNSNVPVPVGVKSYGFVSLAGGNGFVCALDQDGMAWCWGRNTGHHELGTPSTEPTPIPTQVSPPEGETSHLVFRLLRSGEHPTCGITRDDEIYCWGHNHQGEAGIGSGSDRAATPTPIMPGIKVKDVYFGVQHGCAITVDDATYCWGDNRNGAVGTGTVGGAVYTPTLITDTTVFTNFGMGWSFTIGIDQGGEAWSWGIASDQILARDTDGEPSPTPTKIDSSLRFQKLDAIGNHVCGLATDGLLYCWGHNGHGRLGTNSSDASSGVPTAVRGQ